MYFPERSLAPRPITHLYAIGGGGSIYSRHVIGLVENVVAAVFQVPSFEKLSEKQHAGHAVFSRQIAMYLAHIIGGLSLSEVGRLFARDRTTVAHACALIEDRRDDPLLDRSLAILEFALSIPHEGGAR